MIKNLFILFAGLLLFQNVKAQHQPTLAYYFKNSGEQVLNKDSADYMMVISPPDKKSDDKLYSITELYPDGATRLIGKSITYAKVPEFEGICAEFFNNGHRKSITNYKNGIIAGNMVQYYPNGKLYAVENHTDMQYLMDVKPDKIDDFYALNIHYNNCNDSLGNMLAENGNGKWIVFDKDFKYITDEGQVANGYREGEWHGQSGDTAKYTCTYHEGKIVSGTGYDKAGKAYPFTQLILQPSYKGEIEGFYEFLRQNIRYPVSDFVDKIQGKVIISFFVEKDGRLTDVKLLSAVDSTLGAEALRVIKLLTSLTPGALYGIPCRMQYTVPISFNLSNDE